MARFPYGVSANDPLILSIVPCGTVLAIELAGWLRTRTATKIDPKIDPMSALRYE